MGNIILEAALTYEKIGYSIIPITTDLDSKQKPLKKALIPWTEFQKRKANAEEICTWWQKWPDAMIGIVTGEISNLFVIDCDTEEGFNNIQEYIPDSLTIPIVRTPRGGWHLWFTYPAEQKLTVGTGVFPHVDFRGTGGYIIAPPSINGNGKAYSWQTKTTPQAIPISLINVLTKNLGGVIKGGGSNVDITKPYIYYNLLQEGTRDNDLFHLANCLVKGGYEKELLPEVMGIFAKNSNPPFPENELKAKILSAIGRAEKRERNLTEEVRTFCLLQEGYFFITDVINLLQLITKQERNHLGVILNRLEKEEHLIEKHGERRGCYRRRDVETNRTKFIPTKIEDFGIKLPFDLNDLCKLYPKSIMVVGGSKGSGKTALAFKIALDNQAYLPILYLHSEGGDEEFSDRLQNWGITEENQIKFEAQRCSKNFQDYITDEKKIFIIDFLEIHTAFYEVAIPIKKIHDKLLNGIAIIFLQKKLGKIFARGDEFSQEVARLYLSMEYIPEEMYTKITIVNAKAPKIDENLSGWNRKIKIQRKGTQLTPLDTRWQKPHRRISNMEEKSWFD